jgi:hypothetical protein
MTCAMRSSGTSPKVGNTPPNPPIRPNSLGQHLLQRAPWFGKFGPLPRLSHLLCWQSKIGSGPTTISKSEDGEMVELARYASVCRSRPDNFSFIVAAPMRLWGLVREWIGLTSKGGQPLQFSIGGPSWWAWAIAGAKRMCDSIPGD